METGSIIRILDDCANYEIIADSPVMPTSELPSHLAVHNYLIGKGSTYKASLFGRVVPMAIGDVMAGMARMASSMCSVMLTVQCTTT
mgnify:CR=1 FL=1